MARSWYTYTGGNVETPSNYSRFTGVPTCKNGPALCSIYAPNGGPNPSVISDTIIGYISAGLATSTAQPALPVNSRLFVRLKSNLA